MRALIQMVFTEISLIDYIFGPAPNPGHRDTFLYFYTTAWKNCKY